MVLRVSGTPHGFQVTCIHAAVLLFPTLLIIIPGHGHPFMIFGQPAFGGHAGECCFSACEHRMRAHRWCRSSARAQDRFRWSALQRIGAAWEATGKFITHCDRLLVLLLLLLFNNHPPHLQSRDYKEHMQLEDGIRFGLSIYIIGQSFRIIGIIHFLFMFFFYMHLFKMLMFQQLLWCLLFSASFSFSDSFLVHVHKLDLLYFTLTKTLSLYLIFAFCDCFSILV